MTKKREKYGMTAIALSAIALAALLFLAAAESYKYFSFLDKTAEKHAAVNTAFSKPAPVKKRASAQHEIKYRKFFITAPGAERVELLADFNNWGETPIVLQRYNKGYFETSVAMTSGDYKYVFLADGQEKLDALNKDVTIFNGRNVNIKTVR